MTGAWSLGTLPMRASRSIQASFTRPVKAPLGVPQPGAATHLTCAVC